MELLLIISAVCILTLLIFRFKAARTIAKLTVELRQRDEVIFGQNQEKPNS